MALQERLDSLLSRAIGAGDVPGLVAVVGDREGTRYAAGFGMRALGGDTPMTADTVVWLASMTKAITATAAMQQVEAGRLSLDAPAADIMPELGKVQRLDGFDEAGTPRLLPLKQTITLRHLLSHTVGFSYEFSNPNLARYMQYAGTPSILACARGALDTPTMFEPGERWEYGTGIDWAGLMVQKVTGKSLENYLKDHLCGPLGMPDTAFNLSHAMRSRLSGMHARAPDGQLATMPFELPQHSDFQMGGGALYGTALDYLRFMRMILNGGQLDGVRVLKEDTVREMLRDQAPGIGCGFMNSISPEISHHAEFFPPEDCGWGLSFLLSRKSIPGGRKAGSVAWAGLSNVYYWIDPASGVCAMLGTQLLPFFDPKTIEVLKAFEREIYA